MRNISPTKKSFIKRLNIDTKKKLTKVSKKLLFVLEQVTKVLLLCMKTNELIKLIEKDGWQEVRQRGSHKQFHHHSKSGTVTIPYHGNKDVPKWLEKSVLKQAGLK